MTQKILFRIPESIKKVLEREPPLEPYLVLPIGTVLWRETSASGWEVAGIEDIEEE